MHGSTSPAKKGLSSHSRGPEPCHVTWSRTRPTARRASTLAGSSPRWRSSHRTCIVEFHPRFHAAPPHRPSAAWRASSRAPTPSLATLARSAATSSAGVSVKSRITCQRIDGSESSSQSTTVTGLPPAVRTGLLALGCGPRLSERADLRQLAPSKPALPAHAGSPIAHRSVSRWTLLASRAACHVLLERCASLTGAGSRETAGQHGDVAQLEEHLLCKQRWPCAVLRTVRP